ncbi:MAG: ABCB family ABC transporter ATP-binding protein/permease, partial [Rhizobiaceae bacterium]
MAQSNAIEKLDKDILDARAGHFDVLLNLLPYVWPNGRRDLQLRVILAIVALVVAKVVTVGIPIVYKTIVDWLTNSASGEAVRDIPLVALAAIPAFLICAYGVGWIMMVVLTQIRDVLFAKVGSYAVRSVANRTFEHLHRLSLRFHLERRTGGLSRVIERGTKAVDLVLRLAVLISVPAVIEVFFMSGVLAYYVSFNFVLIVLVTIAIYLWFTFKASEWRIGIRRELNESDTEAYTRAIDSLLNYETVKYFGNEGLEARRYDDSMARYEHAAVRTYFSLGVLNSGQAIIYTSGLTVCMLLTARGVVQGTLTVGDFVMINALLIQLYLPLNAMGTIYREIRQGLVDLETMFALLNEPPEIVDRPGAKDLVVTKGAVCFEDVSFSYEAERKILKNVSFEVPAGKMVAIVGTSGAGKSTISRLLFRFYQPSSGRITIDGQDILDVTQSSLRRAVGMVPQDTVLFNDTIAYNIRYGRPDATGEEVQRAASLAQIDDLIEALPQGY